MPALGGKLARDAGFGGGLGVVAAQPLAVLAGTGHGSVEGEADGIQHAGLAGAGGAVQQEQPVRAQPVEVDVLGAGERAERGNFEAVDPHRDISFQAHGFEGFGQDGRFGVVGAPAADVFEEAAADGQVVLGLGEPAAVARPGAGGGAFRIEPQHQGVREAGAQPLHGLGGALGVGQGDLAIGGFGPGEVLG